MATTKFILHEFPIQSLSTKIELLYYKVKYIYINCKKMYEEEREKNLTLKVKVFDFVGEYNKKKRYETM